MSNAWEARSARTGNRKSPNASHRTTAPPCAESPASRHLLVAHVLADSGFRLDRSVAVDEVRAACQMAWSTSHAVITRPVSSLST